MLRSLLDPNLAALRTAPGDERDLAINANNSWILSYDNMSGVPLWLSDEMCIRDRGNRLTQRQVADAVGITEQAMSEYLLGRRLLKRQELEAVEAYLTEVEESPNVCEMCIRDSLRCGPGPSESR